MFIVLIIVTAIFIAGLVYNIAQDNIDRAVSCMVGLLIVGFFGWLILGNVYSVRTDPTSLEIIRIVKLPGKAIIYTKNNEFNITDIEQYNKLSENSTNNISFIRKINMYGGTAGYDVNVN